MRTHHVEVDEEVFAFVKSHAEPLVDTFNTSLRRLLLPGPALKKESAALPPGTDAYSFPTGTPQALRHIIEVSLLTLGGAYTRRAATKFVAKRHNVADETVTDKYARQLGLTVSQFDRLLEEPGRNGLKQLLRTKFPRHADVIERYL